MPLKKATHFLTLTSITASYRIKECDKNRLYIHLFKSDKRNLAVVGHLRDDTRQIEQHGGQCSLIREIMLGLYLLYFYSIFMIPGFKKNFKNIKILNSSVIRCGVRQCESVHV